MPGIVFFPMHLLTAIMQRKKGQEDIDFVYPVLVTLFSDFLRQISSTMYSDNRFMDVTE